MKYGGFFYVAGLTADKKHDVYAKVDFDSGKKGEYVRMNGKVIANPEVLKPTWKPPGSGG